MIEDLSAQTPLLKGYRAYSGEAAVEKGLLAAVDYETLGRPAEMYLLYALGSWTFGDTIVAEATYVVEAGCARELVQCFDAGGGGQHPGATCGSGYWDTLTDLVLPEECPHIIVPGWLDGWRPGWEIPFG